MSLTDWANWDRGFVDDLFDKPKFDIRGDIKATPLTKNYATVGTAFDYALRAKVLYLNHISVEHFKMVASHGVQLFPNKRRKEFLRNFIDKLSEYHQGKRQYNTLLADFISLAKHDSLYRCGQDYPDSAIFEVNSLDVQDLENLTSLIISKNWIAQKQCLLNPTFGQSSDDIGGADTDIIIDGNLIDIKTSKYLKFEREYFRQLIGYWILNNRENNINGNINNLGIYYSRYGLMFNFQIPPCKLENGYNDISFTERQEMPEDEGVFYMLCLFDNSIKEYQNADSA